jgi:acetyl esterase/lipase
MIPPPISAAEWDAQRADLRAELESRLGDLPPLFTPALETVSREMGDGFIVERVRFDNGAGALVPGWLLIPPDLRQPAPGVLFLHAHGAHYDRGKDEVFQTRPSGTAPGLALARAGCVVLCIDAYAFGERAGDSPANASEPGRPTEEAWFKHFLWHGATLWGMMLRDDRLALNALLTRPEVDPARIAATGMSLGGSRATWLSALDDRIKVTVPVGQMTRWRDYAATGQYHLHSIYYYVPGLLATAIEMEHLVGLTAPRPQAILIGDGDPLSPIEGVRRIVAYAEQVYAVYDAADRFIARIEAGVGHVYTPSMQETMLAALRRWL